MKQDHSKSIEPESLLERAARVIPGGVSARSPLPVSVRYTPVSASGAWFRDAAGLEHLDYNAGAGALILGHGHPSVGQAVAQQAQAGVVFFGMSPPVVIDLAEAVVESIAGIDKVVFTTTGSEATAYALHLARAATGREKILKFEGGYHGNHDYSLIGVTPQRPSNYPQAMPDTAGTPKAVSDSVLVAPYNDLSAVQHLMVEYWRDVAAIIVEPVQRELFPKPGFLEGLRALADAHGCLLIFDEVVCGFRLAYAGAREYFGVTPHLSCFGKILGGGLPIGAVAGPSDLMDLTYLPQKPAGRVLINGTHHGTPLAAAAGLAALSELRKPQFYEELNGWCATLRAEIAKIFRDRNFHAHVIGGASIWHLSFSDKTPLSYADTLGGHQEILKRFDMALVRAGMHLLPGSRRLTTAAHGDRELEATLRAVYEVCRAFP